MKNVIFVEGVSGVGKSTTVRKLGEALSGLGYQALCHLEGDLDDPLDLCWTAYLEMPEYEDLLMRYPAYAQEFEKNVIDKSGYVLLRYQAGQTRLYPQEIHDRLREREFCLNPAGSRVPQGEYTQVFVNLWRRFAQGEPLCDYAIFDASLVSHRVNDLLRNYNASENELVGHLETLLQIIRHLNPIVFYLSPEDVRERLIKARSSRAEAPLDEERIAFWQRRWRMDMAVLPGLSVESHIIHLGDDSWDGVVPQILSRVV